MKCEEEIKKSERQSEQAGGERQSGEGECKESSCDSYPLRHTLKNQRYSIGWKGHLSAHWWIVADDLLLLGSLDPAYVNERVSKAAVPRTLSYLLITAQSISQ